MLSKLVIAGIGIAAAITLAPVAAADADDLTNADVAGNTETVQEFTPFDTGIEPVLGTGGQGAFDFYQDFDDNPVTPDTFSFDNGMA